ncbi:hypothetical protein D3C76_1366550 [compost metagenome]
MVAHEFARSDQCSRTLELLHCQKTQCVSHQNIHAALTPGHRAYETAMKDLEGRQSQIGFGFSSSRRKPQQVHASAVFTFRVHQTGQDQ